MADNREPELVKLLRGVIDFGDGTLTPEQLVDNWARLAEHPPIWGRDDDERVFGYVGQFFAEHSELPSAETIRSYFEPLADIDAVERLKDIEAAAPCCRSNYAHVLATLLEQQRQFRAQAILRQAHQIVSSPSGIEVGEGRETRKLKGVDDALEFLAENAESLRPVIAGPKTEGDVRKDGQAMFDEYTAAEKSGTAYGAFCGIEEIDIACHGAKRGELWVHAASFGELKSTFSISWAYNAVTHYKKNVVYFSFEMPYAQVRRNIFAAHTANLKWLAQGRSPLNYREIRDGTLSKADKDFYVNEVIPDFCNSRDYCHFKVVASDRNLSLSDIRSRAERFHKQFDVGMIVLDHGQLIEPDRRHRHRDYVVELNAIVRDAKRLALTFNGGEGVPVLLLWQVNREGKEEADKNGGTYTSAKALTYSNEVEKSADVITTTYLNETYRNSNSTRISNLKNRDNPLFPAFDATVDFGARRIFSRSLLVRLGPFGAGMSTEDDYALL